MVYLLLMQLRMHRLLLCRQELIHRLRNREFQLSESLILLIDFSPQLNNVVVFFLVVPLKFLNFLLQIGNVYGVGRVVRPNKDVFPLPRFLRWSLRTFERLFREFLREVWRWVWFGTGVVFHRHILSAAMNPPNVLIQVLFPSEASTAIPLAKWKGAHERFPGSTVFLVYFALVS